MARLLNMTSFFRRRDADVEPTHEDAATVTVEVKPDAALAMRPPRTNQTEEVMGLVRKIGDHLDHQTTRTERLLGLMDRMPQALDALPEINRQNARLLDALHDHFQQASGRETSLNTTLSQITKASGHQTEVLGLVQQQLDANDRHTQQLTDTLGAMNKALTNLADSNTNTVDVVARLTESSTRRETDLAAMLGRSQRWMLAAVLLCSVGAIAAVAAAVLVAR